MVTVTFSFSRISSCGLWFYFPTAGRFAGLLRFWDGDILHYRRPLNKTVRTGSEEGRYNTITTHSPEAPLDGTIPFLSPEIRAGHKGFGADAAAEKGKVRAVARSTPVNHSFGMAVVRPGVFPDNEPTPRHR